MPWFALLAARGVPVLRIEPRHAKRAPGRPHTDRLDCQGLHRLPASGLRAGALRPADQGGVRRGSLRHRHRLLTSAAHPLQHRHQAVPQRTRKRTPVVRDRTGGTGLASLQALLAGERPPVTLATRRHPQGQHAADPMANALPGFGRAEHRLA